jgi:hypothetical protein
MRRRVVERETCLPRVRLASFRTPSGPKEARKQRESTAGANQKGATRRLSGKAGTEAEILE